MTIENPAALQYFITEDIYLIKGDVNATTNTVSGTVAIEAPPLAAIPHNIDTEHVIETPPTAFKYLGKNLKGFLILFHANGTGKLDDKHFEALLNTLQRKGLNLDDTAMVDLYQHPGITIEPLTDYFKPAKLLLLGKQCLLPGWDDIPLNRLTTIGSYTALHTYTFDEMISDREKVRAFWEQMKEL